MRLSKSGIQNDGMGPEHTSSAGVCDKVTPRTTVQVCKHAFTFSLLRESESAESDLKVSCKSLTVKSLEQKAKNQAAFLVPRLNNSDKPSVPSLVLSFSFCAFSKILGAEFSEAHDALELFWIKVSNVADTHDWFLRIKRVN